MTTIYNKVSAVLFCSLFMCTLCVMTSCDDMFEPADENNRSEEAMVEESQYTYGLLMYGYGRLPYQTTTQTDVATDDAVYNLPSITTPYRSGMPARMVSSISIFSSRRWIT